MIATTTTRPAVLQHALPEGFCETYGHVNKAVRKRDVGEIVEKLVENYPKAAVAASLDKIKDLGFRFAAQSGLTISMDDVKTPPEKGAILDRYEKDAEKIESQFKQGHHHRRRAAPEGSRDLDQCHRRRAAVDGGDAPGHDRSTPST